jgi:phage FluMu protein gp41
MALRKAGLVNPTGITSITAATYDTTYADDCSMILTELTAADTVMGAEGTYVMVDGQVVDMFNRNINWNNNAAVWSPALSHFMDTMSETPWSWDVSSVSAPTYDITPATYDTTYSTDCTEMTVTELTAADTVVVDAGGETLVVTTHDTMMTAAEQLVWADDSTLATINSGVGVTSTMNAVLSAPDLSMLLQEEYIRHQILRTLDFRDDQSTNGVGATYEWMYEHDGNYNDIEWPLHMDFRYSDASTAATHSTTGGPIGDPRWVPHALGNMSADNASLPKSFELKQNYPNPFNPSTDIVFNLEQSSNITLTIFNVLGQKVKVLADESKLAGTYSLSWDGRDDMGALVSTGLYFYTLTDGSKSVTKKMALMK